MASIGTPTVTIEVSRESYASLWLSVTDSSPWDIWDRRGLPPGALLFGDEE